MKKMNNLIRGIAFPLLAVALVGMSACTKDEKPESTGGGGPGGVTSNAPVPDPGTSSAVGGTVETAPVTPPPTASPAPTTATDSPGH